MAGPFVPTPQATPVVNPAVGSTGAPPLPYISNSEYIFAPTGMAVSDLNPGAGPAAQAQSLADVIRRATRWADSICFGADPGTNGASIAASLTVDQATIRIKRGELRLICDYRPLVELVGVAIGTGIGSLAPIDASLFAQARPGRRTWTLPFSGPGTIYRSGDLPTTLPYGASSGSVYAVWSYVNGYPHTSLASNVAQGATTCVVSATDGGGGLWAVYPASGAFPGTDLQVVDGQYTERVFVQAITPNSPSVGQAPLTTTPFANAHTVPASPDFIPLTGIPENVHQVAISLTTMLIKTRGVRGLVMPTTPGARPSDQMAKQLGQAGALEDYDVARKLLAESGLIVHLKHAGSY